MTKFSTKQKLRTTLFHGTEWVSMMTTDAKQTGAGAHKRLGQLSAAPDGAARQLPDQHHQIAFFIAKGWRWLSISRETGISMSHIQALHARPEFRQLVEVYRSKIDRGDLDVTAFDALRDEQRLRLANLRLALEEQQWRLLNQPETVSNRELQEMIADHSDRLDMGKTQKHLHGHVNLAADLALARQKRLQLSASE